MIYLHKELCMDMAGWREREGKQGQRGSGEIGPPWPASLHAIPPGSK